MAPPEDQIIFEAPESSYLNGLINGYSVEKLIATGGMGAVYLGTQISLDRTVAIKILPREFGEDEEFREAFQREAKVMASINHPNLIAVYDFGEIDGLLYLIMEYAESTLQILAKTKKLDEVFIVKICSQIAYGLNAAHASGILHRDIKPANILLNNKQACKITDFGLARPQGQTESGVIYGTPGYTAPEVLSNPELVDTRADIFSLGVIIYQLLTGKFPLQNYITAQSLCQCNKDFDKIIRKATHTSPKMRYKSAKEVGDALMLIHANLRPPTTTGRFDINTKSKLITDTGNIILRTQTSANVLKADTAKQVLHSNTAAFNSKPQPNPALIQSNSSMQRPPTSAPSNNKYALPRSAPKSKSPLYISIITIVLLLCAILFIIVTNSK